jgi:flagellin
MAQVINTNVSALFAGAALNKSANALQTAQTRLSSGLRINSAKDDATGLSIATDYDSDIRGTNMAIRNSNDAISKAQTNDGYAAQITENLQRLREIAVQLGGTAAGTESTALVAENARLAGKTAAVGNVVTDGDGNTTAALSGAITATTGLTVAAIDTDIASVKTARENYGADMVTFGSVVSGLQNASVNLSASFSRIMDTDYAAETQNMTRNNILQQAGTAVLSQANQTPNSVLGLLR